MHSLAQFPNLPISYGDKTAVFFFPPKVLTGTSLGNTPKLLTLCSLNYNNGTTSACKVDLF